MPRYSLEKLAGVSPCISCAQDSHGVPLILDDLPEAVYHAIVALVTNSFAGLELSASI